MTQIVDNWLLAETAPDACLKPSELANKNLEWLPACVPGTVAQSLSNSGKWSLNDHFDFDAQDYWYKTKFSLIGTASPMWLQLDGLATLCEVWLNGQRILESDNMFLSHQIAISEIVQAENTLYLCFRSLTKALSQRRPRPRWKTKLVEKQQLRWFRTTLLGRIPGWTPPVAPVGPWKAISLSEPLTPLNIDIVQTLDGRTGIVKFSCDIHHANDENITAVLDVGGTEIELSLKKIDHGCHIYGKLHINDVELWQPHIHGVPKIYSNTLNIKNSKNEISWPLTPVGFKKSCIDQTNNNFCITVNNKKVFCRGACWTVNDIVSLVGESRTLEQTLILMRNAGVNMIRIGGTMTYEQDDFYKLCDKLGIMVWQDFMFSNMDYPVDDEKFNRSIKREASQHLARLRKHVCVTVFCGNSEIEQQAAMLGMPPETWSNEFFISQLPKLCYDYAPDIPYVSSTPTGGNLPFHTDAGVTHYYGVGAYQRPVSEVRQHNVKFTPECLGFANIPVAQTRNNIIDKQIPVTHHPKWKERTPRDTGTGWDFEDIRDHYLNDYFSINPTELRSYDNEKYLALSEIISGEILSQVYSEWRSKHSHCSGALVWFLKDLWPGAGWGIIDSHGLPKAVYYYLKRCWQPVNVCITNESLNGLDIHIINETNDQFKGDLEVTLLNEFSATIANEKIEVTVDSNSIKLVELDQLLGAFLDTAYAYRFGPAKHTVVSVRLTDFVKCETSTAYYFPNRALPRVEEKLNLKAVMRAFSDDVYLLELSCDRFLYVVNVDIPGFLPNDNYFHMMPGVDKSIKIERCDSNNKVAKGYISAINMVEDIKIKVIPN